MKRGIFFLAFVFLIGAATDGARAQVQIGGYVKSFVYPNLRAPYELDRLGSRLQLTFSRPFSDRGALFAAFNFNYDARQAASNGWRNRQTGLTIYPVEAYLDLYFKTLDVRIGNQFILWGITDWINPTDNINPWDYLNITAEIEDYRVPVWAARVHVYLGDWTIEGVWVPEFQPHRLPDPEGVTIRQFVRLPKLSFFQGGTRIALPFRIINVSLSYYQGYDKWPTYQAPQFQPRYGTNIALEKKYFWVQIFGADFVTTFGKFALKGEGAYTLTEDKDGNDPTIRNPQLQYVLGIDYYATDQLTLNVQFVQTRRFFYRMDQEIQAALQMRVDPRRVPEAVENSASLRTQWSPINFFSLQLIGVLNFRYQDYFLLPILTYDVADGIRLYAGITYFNGPAYSLFGQSKTYSRAFAELKFNF
ncbi:MAG: hypothetical protein GXO78_02185 [Calditrichaeota bacterium]|nr:hypothetical protein [Calditrichota bacterium]